MIAIRGANLAQQIPSARYPANTGPAANKTGWEALLAHPWFPTGVAIWFGATFALSVVAVRGALLERLVLQTQLDLVLTVAAPPLGLKAKLMLALLFGVLGAGLGWLAARAIRSSMIEAKLDAFAQASPAAAEPVESIRLHSRDAHPDAPARRPISAHDELGRDGFDGRKPETPAPAPARPAAALLAPTRPVPLTLNKQAPVVAPEVVADAVPFSATPLAAKIPAAPVPAPQPLFGSDLPPLSPEDMGPEAPIPASAWLHADTPTIEPEAQPEPAVLRVSPPFAGFAVPEGPSAAQRIASAPLVDLSHTELVERLAISINKRTHGAHFAEDSDQNRRKPLSPQAAALRNELERQLETLGEPSFESLPLPKAPAVPDVTASAPDAESALRAALASLQDIK